MQEQRSSQLCLVATCLLSCVMVGMIVVVNQSSIEIRTLHSVLKVQESKISLLEKENTDLRLVLENIQWKMSKEQKPTTTDRDNISKRQSSRPTGDLPGNPANQAALKPEGTLEDKAKGDGGALLEGHGVSVDGSKSDRDKFHLRYRYVRSTHRRNASCKERRKENKRCKGAKGERGKPGRTSYVGEKGQKGERGHRGPPGECDCTTTDSPTTTSRQSTQPHQFPAILSAHFEGDVESLAIITRRDPINRGYVDLNQIDGGWVPYWKYADWMDADVRSKFVLESTGNVTVTRGGIYYVYSQMLYYDPSVFMGHSLYIGEQKRFSCTESTVDRDRKFNTCYIGGVVQINTGDKVGIRVSYSNRVINLHPHSTHFGFIKLS